MKKKNDDILIKLRPNHKCNLISLRECLSTPNIQLSTPKVDKAVGHSEEKSVHKMILIVP